MKIVINKCYGCFGLSDAAIEHFLKLKGKTFQKMCSVFGGPDRLAQPGDSRFNVYYMVDGKYFSDIEISRVEYDLIATIEILGSEAASGWASELKIIDIPDGTKWEVNEYDGLEWIAEVHKKWS